MRHRRRNRKVVTDGKKRTEKKGRKEENKNKNKNKNKKRKEQEKKRR
jgi:hypothetical protein